MQQAILSGIQMETCSSFLEIKGISLVVYNSFGTRKQMAMNYIEPDDLGGLWF